MSAGLLRAAAQDIREDWSDSAAWGGHHAEFMVAVADWLDHMSQQFEHPGWVEGAQEMHPATAVARAHLGGDGDGS